MKRTAIFILSLIGPCLYLLASRHQPEIQNANFTLKFPKTASGHGISISHSGQEVFVQSSPIHITICPPGTATENDLSNGYQSVEEEKGTAKGRSQVHTPDGFVFDIEDCYETRDSAFVLHRRVKVVQTGRNGYGFATGFSLQERGAAPTAKNHEYFIPSILYRNTSEMYPHSIAADLNVKKMYVKETRTGIPMAMFRNTDTGYQLSLLHHPDIETAGCPDGGMPGIIDNGIRFGAIGYSFPPILSVDFRFPCAEGPRTYEAYRNTPSSPWVKRYHRLQESAVQEYTLYILPDLQPTYNAAMTNAYAKAFNLTAPHIVSIDMDSIYAHNLHIFRTEYRQYGTATVQAAGLPWSLDLPDGTNQEGVSFQMGFVGQQIAVGYHLLRYGLENNDPETVRKGQTIVNFWASPTIMDTYFPTVWWDPSDNATAGRRREYPCFLRCMTDGMEGLLDACRIAEAYGIPHTEWEAALRKTGEHFLEKQETDGAFRRAYRTNGEVETGGDRNTQGMSKLNTPVPIRFLAKMYEHTQDERYKRSALKAAEFAYHELYLKSGKYVGGTPDNPNTVDKEAAIFAFYGFNAAYELSGDKKFLQAAEHAALCAMSWVYCYDFPVPNRNENEQKNNPFGKGGTSGFSIISTGHSGADNFIAYLYYEMYKLYIRTGKPIYKQMALFLQNNTKSCTDFDGRMHYKYRAFMPEATNIADMAFRSVNRWLPWSGIANIEPIVQMEDAFGENDIRRIPYSLEQLREKLSDYGCGGRPLKQI